MNDPKHPLPQKDDKKQGGIDLPKPQGQEQEAPIQIQSIDTSRAE